MFCVIKLIRVISSYAVMIVCPALTWLMMLMPTLLCRFAGRPGKYNKLFNRWRLEEVSESRPGERDTGPTIAHSLWEG